MPETDAQSASRPAVNPYVLRPFFGREPALPASARRTLLLVSVGMFFENYDLGLVNAALPQITADLGIAAEDTGFYLGAIRLGGVGAFLLLPFSDRFGRRRVFLASLVGMTVGTLASGISQTPLQFAAAQFFARIFMLMASALSVVIVVEEFPASQRGGGLGLLALLGGVGFGLCAILYSQVESLPFGWRSLYLFGVVPLLILPAVRRALAETRRFEAHSRELRDLPAISLLQSWFGPLRELARTHPRRVAAVGVAGFFGATGTIGLFQYTSYFAQEVHGWTPGQYALLVLGGGAIGVMGNVFGGRGSDRFGRRAIGAVVLCLAPAASALFFNGPSFILPIAWGCFVFCTSSFDVVIRALSAELFPTAQRGTSTGWMMLVQTMGWTSGLIAIGFATDSISELGPTITAVSFTLFLAAMAILAVPETRCLELETITKQLK